jgi:NAD(P)-dependent dehydrogenase (short-subunit alcohol dehydrogenase family)
VVIEADVRDHHSVESMFDRATAQLGDIGVCVTSAGIWPEESVRLDELSPERLENVLGTNLFGTIWTARSFLRQVKSRNVRGSSLVLIGSTAGRFGEAGHADYSISKAGLRGLMLSYKNEVVLVDPQGRCNLVEPGWTATPMTDTALDDDALLRRSDPNHATSADCHSRRHRRRHRLFRIASALRPRQRRNTDRRRWHGGTLSLAGFGDRSYKHPTTPARRRPVAVRLYTGRGRLQPVSCFQRPADRPHRNSRVPIE